MLFYTWLRTAQTKASNTCRQCIAQPKSTWTGKLVDNPRGKNNQSCGFQMRSGKSTIDLDSQSDILFLATFHECQTWVLRSALLFFNHFAAHVNTTHQCNFPFSGGGVWFAAGLFRTSCYYILVTNQPHSDAACLTSLRALEAFSSDKDLTVPNSSGGDRNWTETRYQAEPFSILTHFLSKSIPFEG